MLNDVKSDAESRMKKAIEALQRELSSVRTGRASPALVERVEVDYYGAMTPLNQLAGISVPEARLLVIQPWDKGSLQAIEKAIRTADLGVNPTNDGDVIRISIPALTEERRKEMVKVVKSKVEDTRVAIRNIRRDAISQVKELAQEKMIGEDEERRGEQDIQDLTDKYVARADAVGKEKEDDVLEV
ncbi:MAG: ribosome recycling factor [Sphaerobacteraceae bacterium]|nr:MAG: ribosome recycling factor [Sphaerobacteraceae bacterium]